MMNLYSKYSPIKAGKCSLTLESGRLSQNLIQNWAFLLTILPSTHSGVLGPPLLIILTFPFKKSNIMAPGRRNVCGGTSSRSKPWRNRWPLLLLMFWGDAYLPTFGLGANFTSLTVVLHLRSLQFVWAAGLTPNLMHLTHFDPNGWLK